MFLRNLVTILLTLFFTNQPVLLALECRDLFRYTQEANPSFFISDKPFSLLSKINSSFDRFKKGRRGVSDPNSYIEIDTFEGSSNKPYPVIKVDMSILSEDEVNLVTQQPLALINSPTTMILVLDSSIKKSSIKSISYQGTKLKVTKIKTLDDKTLYQLSSEKNLKIDDDYAQAQKDNPEVKTLQEFLSLYNIPQNEGQMLEFLYPPMQSVINITLLNESDYKDEVELYEDIYSKIYSISQQIREEGEKSIVFDKDDEIKNKMYHSLFRHVFSKLEGFYQVRSVFSFFDNSELNDGEDERIKEQAQNQKWFPQTSLDTRWYDNMAILNNIIFRTSNDQDFDQKLDELVNNLKVVNIGWSLKHNLQLSLDDNEIKQETKILLKKIIWLVRRIDQEIKGLPPELKFLRSLLDPYIEQGGCTATVVSSNTIITAAHCLEFSDAVRIQIGGKKIESIAYYIHPGHLIKDYEDSGLADIGIVRFPDGTFDNMIHAKINFSADRKNAIFTTTQGKSNIRKVILAKFENDYFKDNDFTSDAFFYKSFKGLRPGDSGSPLFGQDGSLIGVLQGIPRLNDNLNNISMIEDNRDFIEWVVSIDPKVKIRGVNID